jgi:hypothetical protein
VGALAAVQLRTVHRAVLEGPSRPVLAAKANKDEAGQTVCHLSPPPYDQNPLSPPP